MSHEVCRPQTRYERLQEWAELHGIIVENCVCPYLVKPPVSCDTTCAECVARHGTPEEKGAMRNV